MEQCTRFYILLRISTTSSASPCFASFFVNPGVVGSVVFSPVIFVGDVYGAAVAEGGHVNIPTFVELQIRSFTKVSRQKNYAIFSQ